MIMMNYDTVPHIALASRPWALEPGHLNLEP